MIPVVQAPDLNTDRRAVERGEFEVRVAILVQKPRPPILYSDVSSFTQIYSDISDIRV